MTSGVRIASAIALTGAVMLALASCTSAGEDTGTESEVDTSAPLYDKLPDAIKDAGQITMAGDTHPPYRTLEEDGSFTGLDPDLQEALSTQLGVPFVMETASGLDAMLSGMLSGRYDGFNGPVRATKEREEQFDAIVWMTTRTSYVYLSGRSDDLGSPEALCGAHVAGVTGSVSETQLDRYNQWCADQGLEPATFDGLADSNATFLAVKSERADYAATTQGGAIDLMSQEEGSYDYLVQSDEQGAGVDLLAMYLPKDTGLSEVMLEAFQGIFDNGDYAKIMADWDISDVAVDEPILNPITSGQG